MSKNYKIARQLLLLVSLAYMTQFLGTILKNDVLKYFSASSQLYLSVLTFTTIYTNRSKIYWIKVLPFLFIIFCYPLINIFYEIGKTFQIRTFIDGIMVSGAYYLLGFTGLAMASVSNKLNVFKLLYRYSLYFFPIGITLTGFAIYYAANEQKIFTGQLAIVCCFIPMASLAFLPIKKNYTILGWIGVVLILIIASKIWSRSYTIVGVLCVIFSVNYYFGRSKLKTIIVGITFILVATSLGLFGFLTDKTTLGQTSIVDKYQFDSLFKSINLFFQDGDFGHIFYWEGNSRSEILLDAFRKFSIEDWIFGRGVFGKYESFEKRHTIEIGYAQELFRWGCIYLIALIYFFTNSFVRLRKI